MEHGTSEDRMRTMKITNKILLDIAREERKGQKSTPEGRMRTMKITGKILFDTAREERKNARYHKQLSESASTERERTRHKHSRGRARHGTCGRVQWK